MRNDVDTLNRSLKTKFGQSLNSKTSLVSSDFANNAKWFHPESIQEYFMQREIGQVTEQCELSLNLKMCE